MKNNLTTAQTKNLIRRARVDYAHTHALLGQVSLLGAPRNPGQWCGMAVDAETVLAVAANYRAAQALHAYAFGLRLTRQVQRLRRVAADNLDVAEEALNCLTCRANRGVICI